MRTENAELNTVQTLDDAADWTEWGCLEQKWQERREESRYDRYTVMRYSPSTWIHCRTFNFYRVSYENITSQN